MAFVFFILVFFIDHYCLGGGGGDLISIAYCPFFIKKRKRKKDIFSSPEPLGWWAYRIARPLSSVCVSVFSNIFSETTEPFEAIFHVESQWDGGMKVCSNGPGRMTKIAAMPIYRKNFKKSSSPEQNGWWPWNLVCSTVCMSTTKFIQMMTLGWRWPFLRQGQIWSLMLLYGKKVKQWIFSSPELKAHMVSL